MMRRLHRWISIMAAVFLLNVAVTGSLLAVDELKDRVFGMGPGGPGPGGPPHVAPAEALPAHADFGAMIGTVYAAALAADADDPVTMIRLQVRDGEAEGLVQYNGETPGQVVFDAHTGRLARNGPADRPPGVPQVLPGRAGAMADAGGRSYHQLLKHWHRGDFLGWNGRWMDIATGAALLFLSLSGLKVYVDMLLSRRRRDGRLTLLWR